MMRPPLDPQVCDLANSIAAALTLAARRGEMTKLNITYDREPIRGPLCVIEPGAPMIFAETRDRICLNRIAAHLLETGWTRP